MIRQLLPNSAVLSGVDELEAYYALPQDDPHVRVNFVATLDGVIEVNQRSGPLGNASDRAAFMAMRAVSDVVLVGAGTVRSESYGPVKLDEGARRRRDERGQSELPRLAVVTAQGDLDPGARIFSGAQAPLLLTTGFAAERNPALLDLAEVVMCGEQHVDLHRAYQELLDRGLARILCEGGPALFRTLLINDLVDELCLSLAPVLAGSEHRHLTADAPLPDLAQFELAGLLEGDGMIIARYRRDRGK